MSGSSVKVLPRFNVRIKVHKRVDPEYIFSGNVPNMPGTSEPYMKCRYEEGMEWIVNKRIDMPDGFCSWAWRDIYKDVSVLAMGGNFDPWVNKGLIYTSCSDGIRPVSFLIERIEE